MKYKCVTFGKNKLLKVTNLINVHCYFNLLILTFKNFKAQMAWE